MGSGRIAGHSPARRVLLQTFAIASEEEILTRTPNYILQRRSLQFRLDHLGHRLRHLGQRHAR